MSEPREDEILKMCSEGDGTQMKLLLEQHKISPTDHVLPSIQLMLASAIRGGNREVLSCLLDSGLLEKASSGHQTWIFDRGVIMEACMPNRLAEFEVLWQRDPSVATTHLNHLGDTLGLAVLTKNVPLVSFLLSHGVDPDQSHFYYRPVLACTAGGTSEEILNLLLDHGATINTTNALRRAVLNQRVEMLRLLVKRGADINAMQLDERGSIGTFQGPVLHIAISRKDKVMTQALLHEFGADPMAADSDGMTALQRAEETDNRDIVRLVYEAAGQSWNTNSLMKILLNLWRYIE